MADRLRRAVAAHDVRRQADEGPQPRSGHRACQSRLQDKAGGLVVDYFGIADDLKRALATYIDSGGSGKPVLPEEDAVAVLQRDYEIVRAMFHGFPYQAYLEGDTAQKMLGLNKGADHILGLEDGKSRYLRACASLAKAYSLASTSDYARGDRGRGRVL